MWMSNGTKNPFVHWDFSTKCLTKCHLLLSHVMKSTYMFCSPVGLYFTTARFYPWESVSPWVKATGCQLWKCCPVYNLLTKSTNFWTCSILVSETLRYAGQLDPALHQKVIPDPGAGMKEFNWAYAALRLKMQDRWTDGMFLLEFSQSRLCTNHARLISRDSSM